MAGSFIQQPDGMGTVWADELRKLFGDKPHWCFLRQMMTIDTPLGRRIKASVLALGKPLVCTRREEVSEAGVESRHALRVIGKASQIQKTIKCHLGG